MQNITLGGQQPQQRRSSGQAAAQADTPMSEDALRNAASNDGPRASIQGVPPNMN